MTQYLGGTGLTIGVVVGYVYTNIASVNVWIALIFGFGGLVVGHLIDPKTRWGPNELPDHATETGGSIE